MNLQDKNKLKRKYKIYVWIEFSIIIAIVSAFIYILNAENVPQVLRITILTSMGISIIAALFINAQVDIIDRRLKRYKLNVKECRTRRKFIKVLDLINAGNFDTAIPIYNQIPAGNMKDFLFAYIICESRYSKDEKTLALGVEKLKEIYTDFDPNTVTF